MLRQSSSLKSDGDFCFQAGQLDITPSVADIPDNEFGTDEYRFDTFDKSFADMMDSQGSSTSPETVVQQNDPYSVSEIETTGGDSRRDSRPKKSSRRSDGQLKGNNPYGSKGTRMCGICRMRKGKVSLSSTPQGTLGLIE